MQFSRRASISSWLSSLARVDFGSHAAERERITNERAELLEAEVTHQRVIYRAKILERLESLSVNSEVWRPVYGPLKAKYAGPVTKLTGLGWEEMRTLSD